MTDRFRGPERRARSTMGGRDVLLMRSSLAVVVGLSVFLMLAGLVANGEPHWLDERLLLVMRSSDNPADAIGPVWFQEAVRDVTALGGVAVVVLVTLATVGFLAMVGKGRAAAVMLAAVLGGQAISSGLKELFDRPRPEVVPHLMPASHGSFPSGHSLLAAVTYLTLGVLLTRQVERPALKRYIVGVAATATILVGVSRVYMGVHYPSDVLAGWAVGWVWATLCWEVEGALQRRGMVEGPDEARPADRPGRKGHPDGSSAS